MSKGGCTFLSGQWTWSTRLGFIATCASSAGMKQHGVKKITIIQLKTSVGYLNGVSSQRTCSSHPFKLEDINTEFIWRGMSSTISTVRQWIYLRILIQISRVNVSGAQPRNTSTAICCDVTVYYQLCLLNS